MLIVWLLSGLWETSHKLTAAHEGVMDVLPLQGVQSDIIIITFGTLTRHLLSNFVLAADIEVALTVMQARKLLKVGFCTVYVALGGLYCLQVLHLFSHPGEFSPARFLPRILYRPLDLILTLNVRSYLFAGSLPPFLLAPMPMLLLVTAIVYGEVSL